MCGQDIATTLQLMKFVRRIRDKSNPRGYKLALAIDWKMVNAHAERVKKSKTRIDIDREALRWTPLVYTYGNQDNDDSPSGSPHNEYDSNKVVSSSSPIRKTPVAAAMDSPEKRKADSVKLSKKKTLKAPKQKPAVLKTPLKKASRKEEQVIPRPPPPEVTVTSAEDDEETDEEEEKDDEESVEDAPPTPTSDSENGHDGDAGDNNAEDSDEEEDDHKTSRNAPKPKQHSKKSQRPPSPSPKRGRKRKPTLDSMDDEDEADGKSKNMILGHVLKARAKKVANLEEEENAHARTPKKPKVAAATVIASTPVHEVKKLRRQSIVEEIVVKEKDRDRISKKSKSPASSGEKKPEEPSQTVKEHYEDVINSVATLPPTPPPPATPLEPVVKPKKEKEQATKDKDKDKDKDTKEKKDEEKIDPEKQKQDRADRYNRRLSKRTLEDTEEDDESSPGKKTMIKKKVKKESRSDEDGVQVSRPVALHEQHEMPKKSKTKKVRRFKGYKYWGAPPSSAKKKKKTVPVAVVAPSTSSFLQQQASQSTPDEMEVKSRDDSCEKREDIPLKSDERDGINIESKEIESFKPENDSSETEGCKSNDRIDKEGMKNNLMELNPDDKDFSDFDNIDSNCPEIDNNDDTFDRDFENMRGDPERPKEPDSESLRVIPSGPSSCNTVYDDSDLGSQPSVPPQNQFLDNENRSSSSCSGGNLPSSTGTVLTPGTPNPINQGSCSSNLQPAPIQQQQQQPPQAQSQNAVRGSILVMPPHQSQTAQNNDQAYQSYQQSQQRSQKGKKDLSFV